MAKVKTTTYLTLRSNEWLKEQAEKQGISKNDYIQILINKEMEKSSA